MDVLVQRAFVRNVDHRILAEYHVERPVLEREGAGRHHPLIDTRSASPAAATRAAALTTSGASTSMPVTWAAPKRSTRRTSTAPRPHPTSRTRAPSIGAPATIRATSASPPGERNPLAPHPFEPGDEGLAVFVVVVVRAHAASLDSADASPRAREKQTEQQPWAGSPGSAGAITTMSALG